MQDLLPAVCAVDLRRLVEHLVDAHERRVEDHALPAHGLPETGHHAHRDKVLRNRHEADGRLAQHLEDLGEGAVVRGTDRVDHGDQHDRRDKVRQVGDGLHRLHKAIAAQFLERQGKHQRRREQNDERGKVELERIADIGHQVRVCKQALKPLEADKLGVKAPEQLVVVERAAQEPHRHVLEQHEVDDNRNHHQVDVAVAPQILLHARTNPLGIENGLLRLSARRIHIHGQHSNLQVHSAKSDHIFYDTVAYAKEDQ